MERHFSISPLNTDKLVKENDLKEITNPVFFDRDSPSPDGLLSNQIFGITKDERAGIFAYIDLYEDFLSPLYYKIWKKRESKLAQVVHGTDTFSIDAEGQIVKDPNGSNGIAFLKKNLSKIKFKRNDSRKRDNDINFLESKQDTMFIRKFIIIPAYYRDVSTDRGHVGVGEINKLYSQLLIAVRSLKESAEYGLNLSNATRGRIQEILVQIYDWFGAGTTIAGEVTGGNIPGKFGVLRRANMSKTADYSTRLVLSSVDLKVESKEDIVADIDHCSLPLASALVNFFPYILFYVRRKFENEFAGKGFHEVQMIDGTTKKVPLKDYQIVYSDENIRKQIDRFIHGYSNRFIPIEVPTDTKEKYYLGFKGRTMSRDDYYNKNFDDATMQVQNRYMTWCDLFYMAACEVSKDKMVLVTRYPMK